ncbi:hypothetical protein BEV13_02580 [Rickettsiella grylli]|uniref:hypothetical protein n=1 Tax=Rickettsiella grylli TaxID=59196 RepID=UPI0008FD26D1|nr:hypothetical protein [Rickettsiella grylli]OJA00738.1 hypothetical protein BEV13_02580 [Rickettsiella grylli]
MTNPNKKNLSLEQDILTEVIEQHSRSYHDESDTVMNPDDESDSGTGQVTLSVETLFAYLNALLNKERRERLDGQKKFGICPDTEDPNHLLGKKGLCATGFNETPKMHPLLAQSQQFSGDDPSINAIPADNREAIKRFPEKRLENQLRLQKNLGLGATKNVTLSR